MRVNILLCLINITAPELSNRLITNRPTDLPELTNN